MAESHRSKSRGLPLTFRLLVALLVGSLFLGVVVTQLARGHQLEALASDQEVRMEKLTASLAARAAPLLLAGDELRLSMLAASASGLGDQRVLILDRSGKVVADTMGRAGSSGESSFSPSVKDGVREQSSPALGLRGQVGEVRVQYLDIRVMADAAPFSWMLFAGTVLTSLTLVLVVGFVSHHWMLQVREAAATAQHLARGETSARCRRRAGGAIHDLQESLHDLGRSLADGDNQARSSLVELGQQMVELLERRGLSGHGERTCRYAMILATRLGLTDEETRDLKQAARLHDLGEAWLRPSLLDKDGPLDEAERACLRSLPDRGASVLGRLPSLRRVAEIIRHHRERYDGSGYPDGLRGERIPLGARILAIADAYDQLTTCVSRGRVKRWPEALDSLCEDRGEHFDPWLLDLFEEEIRKAPMPKNPSHQVMISAAGVLPYKAVQGDWVIDRFPEGEDQDLDEELERLGKAEVDVVEKTTEKTTEEDHA
jgi:HD-GYP domain-containing protein (c-di-GMP phosphodiesterase class II)